MQLSEQEIIRREKLNALRTLGINPYPADLYPVNTTSKQVKENFEEGKKVNVAGRLMSVRDQGKACFAELQDSDGRIQLYFNRDMLCLGEDKTLYNQVFKKLTDLGDFIGVEGELFMTKVGAQCIRVDNFTFLSKTLRPLPLPKVDEDGKVHDAFNDAELRYRMRYVDLVVNPKCERGFCKKNETFYCNAKLFQ
jgi:lysyl-tRNA synthetase, class II